MAEVKETDKFLVNRSGQTYQIEAGSMEDKLLDDDLMLVNRDGVSYKATGFDIKDSLKQKGIISQPSIIAPADNAGELVSGVSDEIIGFTQFQNDNFTSVGANSEFIDRLDELFDGSLTTRSRWIYNVSSGSDPSYVFETPVEFDSLAIYGFVQADGGNYPVKINGVDVSNQILRYKNGDAGYSDYSHKNIIRGISSPLVSIEVQVERKDGIYSAAFFSGIEVNGRLLVDGGTYSKLTVASDQDLTIFQPGNDIQQDSGHTVVSSAITSVGPATGTYNPNPNTSSITGVSALYSSPVNTGSVTLDNSDNLNTNVIFEGNIPGVVLVEIYYDGYNLLRYRINNGPQQEGGTTNTKIGWYPLEFSGTLTKIYLSVKGASSKVYGIRVNGIELDNTGSKEFGTELTFTDDTDLENFRVGDVVQEPIYSYEYAVSTPIVNTSVVDCRSAWDTNKQTHIGANAFPLDASYNGAGWVLGSGSAIATVNFHVGSSSGAVRGSNNLLNWTNLGTVSVNDPLEVTGYLYYSADSTIGAYNGSWLSDPNPFVLVTSTNPAAKTLTVDGGTWNNGETVTGPATTPATGTIGAIDVNTKTIELSVNNEDSETRWIANQGKYIIGELTPSQDAPPSVDSQVFVRPETSEIVATSTVQTASYTTVGTPNSGTWDNVFTAAGGELRVSSSTPSAAVFDQPLTGITTIQVIGEGIPLNGLGPYGKLCQVDIDGTSITPEWIGNNGNQTATFSPPVTIEAIRLSIDSSSTQTSDILFNGEYILDTYNRTTLRFNDDQGFDLLDIGDTVIQNNDAATGTLTKIGDDNSLEVDTSSGSWSFNTGNFVIGPRKALPGLFKLYSSPFAVTPQGALGHTDSDWQITLKTDSAYSNPVDQSFNDSTNLTDWAPAGLETETAYRCRVRYRSGDIFSEWSNDSTFQTDEGEHQYILPPGKIKVIRGGTSGVAVPNPEDRLYTVVGGRSTYHYALGADGLLYRATRNGAGMNFLDESVSALRERPWINFAMGYKGSASGENYSYPASLVAIDENNQAFCYGIDDTGPKLLDNVKRIWTGGPVTQVAFLQTEDNKFYIFVMEKNASKLYLGGDSSSGQLADYGVITEINTTGIPGTVKDIANMGGSSYYPGAFIFLNDFGDLYIYHNNQRSSPAYTGTGIPSSGGTLFEPLQITVPGGTKFKRICSFGAQYNNFGGFQAIDNNDYLWMCWNSGNSPNDGACGARSFSNTFVKASDFAVQSYGVEQPIFLNQNGYVCGWSSNADGCNPDPTLLKDPLQVPLASLGMLPFAWQLQGGQGAANTDTQYPIIQSSTS